MNIVRPTASTLLTLCLTLAVTGCGSSAGSGNAASGRSKSVGSSSTTPAGAPTQNVGADKVLAQAASLKLSDFPSGWTSQPHSSDSSSPQSFNQQMASCLHTSVALLEHKSPAEVNSPDFSDSNGATVNSDIAYEATTKSLSSQFAVLQKPEVPGCLSTALKNLLDYERTHPASGGGGLPAGVSIGTPTVAAMSFPNLGDASVALRATIAVTSQGLDLNVYVDFVAAQKGRAGAILTFESTGTPFDTNIEEQLATLTVGRLADT